MNSWKTTLFGLIAIIGGGIVAAYELKPAMLASFPDWLPGLGFLLSTIGTGGIGMYCLMVAKAAGAGRLLAVDISDYALETAKRLGATHTVNPAQADARAAIYEILPDESYAALTKERK